MPGSAVSTEGVVRAIEAFSETIAHYLMPVIRFVGRRDETFEALNRLYPGLTHEKQFSGKPADLVVFDHLPTDLITPTLQLGADSAYIFHVQRLHQSLPSYSTELSGLNALTLVEPELDVFLWHVKAMLLTRELSYSNGHAVFPELLSIDREQRHAMSLLVDAIVNRRSCVVQVPSNEHRDALLEFLFGSMDDLIAPEYVDADRIDLELMASDRFNIITPPGERELKPLVKAIEASERNPLVLIILVAGSAITLKLPGDMASVALSDLSERVVDAHVLAYWVAAWKSHASGQCAFFSAEVVRSASRNVKSDPAKLRQQLMSQAPRGKLPPEPFAQVLEVYQRLSLDDILGETERQIMLRLKELSPVVEAASHAAGIPLVTFHKRTRRLTDKSSLIELFASVRKP